MIKAPFTNFFFINLKTGLAEIARSQSINAIDILFIWLIKSFFFKTSLKNPLIILHL